MKTTNKLRAAAIATLVVLGSLRENAERLDEGLAEVEPETVRAEEYTEEGPRTLRCPTELQGEVWVRTSSPAGHGAEMVVAS